MTLKASNLNFPTGPTAGGRVCPHAIYINDYKYLTDHAWTEAKDGEWAQASGARAA